MSDAATEEIRALIGRGELLAAADRCDAEIGDDPATAPLELVWLAGLALARCGATDRAERLLTAADATRRATDAEPDLRDDLAGLQARLIKDRAMAATGAARAELARAAADAYAGDEAGTYRLVNEATMRLVAADHAEARHAAEQALALLATAEDDYWTHATRAEVSLLLGRLDDTAAALAAAAATGPDWSMRSSTLRQLRFVCAELGVDPALLDALPLPTVAHYSGHMFAAGPEAGLAEQIRAELVARGVGRVHGSLACGSDTVIVETALDLGIDVHIVIPCPVPEFVDRSVRPGGHEWVERFDRALAAATDVVIEPTIALEDEAMFAYADQLAMGFALTHARRQDAEVFQLAAWDGLDTGGEAGTGAAVRRWRATGNETVVVELDRRRFEPVAASTHAPDDLGDRPRSVKALLFADVKGFSGLSERDLPDFFEEVMAGLASVIDRYGDAVRYRNTWGDAVYLVVDTAGIAADLALEMQRELRTIADRISRPSLSARIGGHAGPVYVGHDHINDEPTFYGTHVTRAARIEPRTPPGEVYVTQHFAALVSLERVDDVRLEYVGHIPTAKDYGAFPMYVLRR
ncbi:MAG: adenylate/guanylate cyclase domain-containing protein [Actinomycetota bacterium]